MTTPKIARIGFRLAVVVGLCVAGFYLGRPLYWKLSATLQEIKEKDYTQEAVKKGFSELMAEAQRSVGWGPGATSKYAEERALEDEGKKQGEMAKPKLKKSKDKKTDSLVSEPTKDKKDSKNKKTSGDSKAKETSDGKKTPKSLRRLLL
ncbi:hypothetical protein R1sor_009335 [Riccia sorocarpa]|uniref:Uncharacterized protein n=1 Tax=Riccia sorocarpa TaxID=122646 RepID=A0ABD3HWV2_9MARC